MDTPIVVYLSGPMDGLPEDNHSAFNEAAYRYREAGFLVLNPADNFGGAKEIPRELAMRVDFGLVKTADVVVTLEGWGMSHGAALEVGMAQAMNLPVVMDKEGAEDQVRVAVECSGLQPAQMEGCGD